MTSPYQPPKASVADVEPAPGSPVKAVVYGVLVDVGGSVVMGIVLTVVYGVVLAASGLSPEEMERAMASPEPLSWISIIGNALGFLASFIGGYVCARVAGRDEYKWAGVVAVISGIAGFLFGMSSYPIEWNLLLVLLTASAVLAGARTAVRRKERKA